ncbi:glycosyltransferase family 39 protein [Aggregicoccus sp. 17bor-14]|uniref:glycosyltransferase family 39 protein n=1 Tax=Myxococcaceae TaxID=31 RepID=UPI00129C1F4D|nr:MULTISPECIES: glycosyltransferase family 39 protein [Myxococcaceae]MBF5046256.1 glycosyltransferase family 39 protein [Simulacricoccus sp. 17bor-14]MRI91979.1 glycosyltransferase family 39 protein [Aggregicoccus sp. 17bor-14]
MTSRSEAAPAAPEAPGLGPAVWGVALAALALHLATNGRYGFFRDELYFIACGQRLAWGYVDQPPLIALVSRLSSALAGDSVGLFRLPAALAHTGLVLLTARLARALGGARPAALLAGVAVAVAPVLVVGGHLLTMNSFEPLLWTGAALLLVRLLQAETPRTGTWAALGLVVGVGLLNKYSMAFWTVALVAGLLATPSRRVLATRVFLLALGLALLCVLPNLYWQASRGFPMLELLRAGQAGKNAPFSVGNFLGQQLLLIGPLAAPLWLAGLAALLAWRPLRPYRALGVGFVAVLLVMVVLKAKTYYLAPAFPLLLAAGGVWAEARLPRLARGAVVALVGLTGLAVAPLGIPVLPVDTFVRYQAALGVQPPRDENHQFNALPQHFADQFGWPELVDAVAGAVGKLSPEERSRAGIFVQNYGEAGALEWLGRNRGLPPVLSGHNTYFLWGRRGVTGEVVLVVGEGDVEQLRTLCREVTLVGRVPRVENAMPYEQALTIHLCRGLHPPLAELWPKVKNYN